MTIDKDSLTHDGIFQKLNKRLIPKLIGSKMVFTDCNSVFSDWFKIAFK
jgi:hypothetical protein